MSKKPHKVTVSIDLGTPEMKAIMAFAEDTIPNPTGNDAANLLAMGVAAMANTTATKEQVLDLTSDLVDAFRGGEK